MLCSVLLGLGPGHRWPVAWQSRLPRDTEGATLGASAAGVRSPDSDLCAGTLLSPRS